VHAALGPRTRRQHDDGLPLQGPVRDALVVPGGAGPRALRRRAHGRRPPRRPRHHAFLLALGRSGALARDRSLALRVGDAPPRALRAILSVLPLDTFTPTPAAVMAVVGAPERVPEPVREFQALVETAAGRAVQFEVVERFAFYERSRAAFAVVATSERRAYGNIILTKGVIP